MAMDGDDREKLIAAASRYGWDISRRGYDIDLTKGARTLTARFDHDWNLVVFRVGGRPGRGGLQGMIKIMKVI
jgi:hypothetical protein